MRIEYQNVDIAQEEHVILKGVNFQAEAGEFVYLIGKVGTGKSSLLKTFYGELDVHTGSARVLDREMTKIKRRHIPALRKRLGIVFQDFQLLAVSPPSEKIRILRKGKSECRTKKNPNAWRVETRMCEGYILIYR